jgi:hypothetical protein
MGDANNVLVLMDDGLGSIVACASSQGATPEPTTRLAWGTPDIQAKWGGVTERFGYEWIPNTMPSAAGDGAEASVSLALLWATLAAARRGVRRVVWPIHAGVVGKPNEMDLEVAAAHVDRALLVTRLASMDQDQHQVASIIVETPYADFSDRQLAELALDMGAPFREAPWWGDDSDEEGRRWHAVFEAIGSAAVH